MLCCLIVNSYLAFTSYMFFLLPPPVVVITVLLFLDMFLEPFSDQMFSIFIIIFIDFYSFIFILFYTCNSATTAFIALVIYSPMLGPHWSFKSAAQLSVSETSIFNMVNTAADRCKRTVNNETSCKNVLMQTPKLVSTKNKHTYKRKTLGLPVV